MKIVVVTRGQGPLWNRMRALPWTHWLGKPYAFDLRLMLYGSESVEVGPLFSRNVDATVTAMLELRLA